ncbi:hypothetical protein EPUS_07498 [Endocarpon pusillum Z07020]|uniref:CorA-like transporter domain-containing protein n=1 Tax=Endocarpon pusillum (strain Z07020 / HMAS-L-300199) TaxID=1263415 RepID=U1HW06_ENDPU|nr:uncharacterized protein EPUS_07498 [Endocarpon pusillum Z07020]ERF73564.1 hypothetical protein EPUS_07498 [Endocarpon pusillum Z07020]
MSLTLTPEYEASYKSFSTYPQNLLNTHAFFPAALRAYKIHLDAAEDTLFVQNENAVDVPIADLDENGNYIRKKNIFSDQKLREYIGDTVEEDVQTHELIRGSYASRPDPKCRFIYFWAKNTQAPLKITRKMLTRIMTYHQVTPQFFEFLFLFGQRSNAHDLRYSGFREKTSLDFPSPGQALPALGRSGKHFQLCYNLKRPESLTPPGTPFRDQEWSIRPAAIFHHFDVETGGTMWIVIKRDLGLKEDIQELTGPDGRIKDRSFATPGQSFRSSLAVHSLLAHWATTNWRWYIQYLEDTVDKETQAAVHGSRELVSNRKNFSPMDLQHVQWWEERAVEAKLILGGISNVLQAIIDYYASLLSHRNFSLSTTCRPDIESLAAQMRDAIADCKMQRDRAELLTQIASQRKTLILQHLQSQATEKMENLSLMTQKEAIAMRIITVVTLIYLPGTFVSTFFSTDVVTYQGDRNSESSSSNLGTSFSTTAMYRWLQVALPLTFCTLGISWIVYKYATMKTVTRLSKHWENISLPR